jgi:hypothetical protein
MPVIDAAFLAMAMRWAMLAVILVGAYWLVGMLRVPARDPKRLKSEVRSQI